MNQTNAESVIRTQKFLMLLTGMWPSKKRTILYRLYQYILLFLITTVIFGLFLQIIYAGTNLLLLSAALSIFISPGCTLVKNILIIYKSKALREILEILEKPIFKKYPDCLDFHMVKSSFRSRTISIWFQIICSLSAGMYSVKSLVSADYLIPFIYEIFDFGKWTIYVQLFENIVLFIISWKDLVIDLLIVGFILIAIGHFNILHDKIVNVKKWAGMNEEEINSEMINPDNGDFISKQCDEKIIQALGECIEYHCNILEYLKHLEDAFTWICIDQFVNSIIVCCNAGFMMVILEIKSVKFFATVAYFNCMMFELFLYCWFGNELMVESYKIGEACYMSDWRNCGTDVRRMLFILMERSKRPFFLTAAKFINLSLVTYTGILRLTYSYFALMQQLYSKSE